MQIADTTAMIPAPSRVEAMDWSLVLISQGIESTILRSETGWQLHLLAPQYDEALRVIDLYRKENRGRRWRREVFQSGLLFDWFSLLWALLVCVFYWLSETVDLSSAGVMSTVAVSQGQWWRLFTAIWLHADVGHLASNTVFGSLLLGLAMGRYGTGPGLLAAYLAGAGGNILGWACGTQPHYSLGASGMVMGCLGLLTVQSISIWRRTPHANKYFLTSLFAGTMLFVLLGLTPGTDVVAHLGGFVSGLAFAVVAFRFKGAAAKRTANLVSVLLFVLLVLLPWGLALGHS